MQKWYDGLTTGQQKFLWAISIVLCIFGIPVTIDFGAGIVMFIPLVLLIYLKLGQRK